MKAKTLQVLGLILMLVKSETAAAAATVRFSQSNYSVTEADTNVAITLVLSARLPETHTVWLWTDTGSVHLATPMKDFLPLDTRVEFAPGETNKVVNVSILDDHLLEGVEDFEVGLSDEQGSQYAGVTILDDESDTNAAGIGFAFDLGQYGPFDVIDVVESTTNVVVVLVRSGSSSEVATIRLRTEGDLARVGEDFAALDTLVTFAPGETNKSVAIPIHDDGLVELVESFTLSLSDPSPGVLLGAVPSLRIRIRDNEIPAIIDSTGSAAIQGYLVDVLPDGKLFVANDAGLFRLYPDGSLDHSFKCFEQLFSTAFATVAQQAGGKLIAAVIDPAWPETAKLIRLNANGSRDQRFQSVSLSGLEFPFPHLVIQSDGRILVSAYQIIQAGITSKLVARLNTDGSVDSGFDASHLSPRIKEVRFLAIEPDGKILVLSESELLRLHSDGAVDETFKVTHTIQADSLRGLAVQPDGSIYAYGTIVTGIIRLRAEGSEDTEFQFDSERFRDQVEVLTGWQPGFGGLRVDQLLALPDSRILVQSRWQTPGDTAWAVVVRLNADGSLDPGFVPIVSQGGFKGRFLFLFENSRTLAFGAWAFNGEPNVDVVWLDATATHRTQVGLDSADVFSPEPGGLANVPVTRIGDVSGTVSVVLKTQDGSAVAGKDYFPLTETLTFGPLETSKTVSIQWRDNSTLDGEKVIRVTLENPIGGVVLGQSHEEITILDDDDPSPRIISNHLFTTRDSFAPQILSATLRVRSTTPVTLEVSSNLATWQRLETKTPSGLLTEFEDYFGPNVERRFYRAVAP